MRKHDDRCPECGAVGRTHGRPCVDLAPTMARDYADEVAAAARVRKERDEYASNPIFED